MPTKNPPKPKKPVKWVATVGFSTPDGRVEIGEVFPGTPDKLLVEQGKVVEADG